MDEYTFLIAAQLKADREKLEREQAERAHREGVTSLSEQTKPTPAGLIPLFSGR